MAEEILDQPDEAVGWIGRSIEFHRRNHPLPIFVGRSMWREGSEVMSYDRDWDQVLKSRRDLKALKEILSGFPDAAAFLSIHPVTLKKLRLAGSIG
jgi:hypothetical protein